MIKASEPSSQEIKIKIPEDRFTKLTFTIGVDSLRNTMNLSKRVGALNPAGGTADGMYWSWNSGYIFVKMEGFSEQAPLDKKGEKNTYTILADLVG